MSDVVIRAEGLGKKYLIGHQTQGEAYSALRDVMMRGAKGLARSAIDMVRGRQLVAGDEVEEFWALKDVNFEIKRGEVVGIIGRNGAGKSTLLKILSRITEPTEGRVEIKGRVASLLEVGTGFHPELTGRENIYLNGAILGMTRAEIKRKFDEIVAFADVEKFLDTPVKRYSSGMYVRLAFAVAAHLEPEILVVDEVLAVGDAEFQKKCLGKMQDVAGHGRTVLFVSHNMGAVAELCETAILMDAGVIATKDAVNKVLTRYEKFQESKSIKAFSRSGLQIEGATFSVCNNLGRIELQIILERQMEIADFCPILKNEYGVRVAIFDLRGDLGLRRKFNEGCHQVTIEFNGDNIVSGKYSIDVFFVTDEFSAEVADIARLKFRSMRATSEYLPRYQGATRIPFKVGLIKQ